MNCIARNVSAIHSEREAEMAGTTYAPLRPPTERDTIHLLNGAPIYLGALVSTGAAVNNATTATPFNASATTTASLSGTLAGKVLLLQPTGAGLISPATSTTLTIAVQTTIPPLLGTTPGFLIQNASAQIIVMRPDTGWLQWLPSASSNLLVWELT